MMRIATPLPAILCCLLGLHVAAAAQPWGAEAQANSEGYYWTSAGWIRAGDSRPYRWTAGGWVLANEQKSPLITAPVAPAPQQDKMGGEHWITRMSRAKSAVWLEPQVDPQAARDAENRRVIEQYQRHLAKEQRIQREALELFPWASQGDERAAYIIHQTNLRRHQAHEIEKARIIAGGLRDFGRGRATAAD